MNKNGKIALGILIPLLILAGITAGVLIWYYGFYTKEPEPSPEPSDCPLGQELYKNKCVDICSGENPYYYAGKCYSTCPAGTTNEIITCTKCPNNQPTYKGKCIANCPVGTKQEGLECVNICPEGYGFIYKGECVAECPYGTGADSNSLECKTCLENQQSYDNRCYNISTPPYGTIVDENGEIVKCPDNAPFSYKNECRYTCPLGTFEAEDETGFACVDYCNYNSNLYYSYEKDACVQCNGTFDLIKGGICADKRKLFVDSSALLPIIYAIPYQCNGSLDNKYCILPSKDAAMAECLNSAVCYAITHNVDNDWVQKYGSNAYQLQVITDNPDLVNFLDGNWFSSYRLDVILPPMLP